MTGRLRSCKQAPLTPEQVKRAVAKAKREKLENKLAGDLAGWGCPMPIREHRFATPDRQWRFDFSWPDRMLAVECEGGTEGHGQRGGDGKVRKSRHLTPSGFSEDCAKYNRAAILGWKVLRYPSSVIQSGEAAREIVRVLEAG